MGNLVEREELLKKKEEELNDLDNQLNRRER